MARPNILLIMTDQQRADTIHSAGNPAIRTPSLDRLAHQGVRFDRAYTESPECVPARALLLTGRWSHETGVYNNATPMAEDAHTFVHDLGEAGYYCKAIGKMHFAPRRTPHGFHNMELSEEVPFKVEEDEFFTFLHRNGYGWVDEPNGIRREMYYLPQVSQLPDPLHTTTWTGDRTVEFLESRRDADDPFFLFTSFVRPHPPFDPTVPYVTLYDPLTMPDPIRGPLDREDTMPLYTAQTYGKWMEGTEPPITHIIKAAYYACITQIDTQIGRILDALERTGLRENTLVVFVSDHGELMGDHYHFGKRSYYEGAARIPFIVSWPGELPQGESRTNLVGLRDLAPTFITLAGAPETGRESPGADLLPVCRDGAAAWRGITVGELFNDDKAIYMAADQRWKYSYMPNGGREQLFDLQSDPAEVNNLAKDPSGREARSRLRRALVDWFREDGCPDRLDGDDLRAAPATPIDPITVRAGIGSGGRDRMTLRFRPQTRP